MNEAAARPKRRTRRTRQEGGEAERPGKPHYRRMVNSFEPIRLLSEDHVAAIHSAALDILADKGMRVLLPEAREIFAKAGAIVDPDTHYVRLGRELVLHALSFAPHEFELRAGSPERSVTIGGHNLAISTAAFLVSDLRAEYDLKT
jgi:trimethylamine--corrinoid protein Co-methyltransferase